MNTDGRTAPTAFTVTLALATVIAASGCCRLAANPVQHALIPSSVAISVPHLEDAVTWYRDVLGFDVDKRSDFPDYHLRIAWLVRDRARLELVELQGSKAPSEILPRFDNPALLQGFGKIAFRVGNAAQLARELELKGVEFQIDLSDDPETRSRSFIILDNNGNWLEFWEPLPS